jgi:tetratricopeptide (TPR) repeat protein
VLIKQFLLLYIFERNVIMKKTTSITISFLLLIALLSSAASAKSSAVLLQEALYAEEVEGNLNSAIKIYEQIIADESAQKPHKAQALYRLGNCYLKLKDEQQAKATFVKLVTEFSDQTEIVAKARPILEELSNADPAALMPPETLAYIELGSPGKQIETILNMLKGTQFENPLAAVGAGMGNTGKPAGEKTPQDIFAALLNPSMMAEFKKIRGMGLGVTGFAGGGGGSSAEGIAVLFPGKSDALRGIILAALGITGRPVEPIEGMQTLALGNMAHAAYDDTIVLISISRKDSVGQLAWAIKQYKGITTNPTLASSNKSFTKISKKDRQQNMVTLWANVDQLYAELTKQFPDRMLPNEMRIAQGFVDFADIDDVISFWSLEEQNMAFQMDVAFKDGHHCLAYDLIRTPHINKAGFEAVPPDAIALVSFALAEAESAQAKTASQKIQNITGLDIGREIFANIEQVTVFAVPAAKTTEDNAAIPPIAKSIGMALTSHNPQQTRQILTTLLRAFNPTASGSQTPPADTSSAKYQFGLANNTQLYCYTDQTSKTTMLSLNPDLLESSLTALKNRKSICYVDGPLKEAVDKLSPNTSKLVLYNEGGALRLASTVMKLPNDAATENALAQLAQACDKTTAQLRTNEDPNSFSLRVSISGLPPLNQVIGPITQLSKAIGGAKAQARIERARAAAPAGIAKATQPPVIDGQAEDLWSNAQKYDIKNVMYTPPSGPNDCSASYKALWDVNNLYLLVEVTDDSLKNDSIEFYNNDAIEIFIDSDNSKSESYGDNGFQFHFDWDKAKPTMGESKHNAVQGVELAMVTTGNGYRTEIKFPWSTLKVKPSAGTTIGFDIHVNDDDDGGDRDTKLAWYGKEDNAWATPQALGNVQLSGLVGWWKLDESEGTIAADSSGNGNDGTLHGNPQWQPSAGKVGGALEFDGVDDYVDTDYATDFPTWTIAAWVKSSAAPSSAAPSGPVHRDKNYQINWNHTTDVFRGAAGVSIEGTWYAASFGKLEANMWYHLAATYDGENLRAYKDGVLVTNNSAPSGNPDAESATLKFGRHSKNTNYFGGTIDDVRIYNYALSESDIAGLVAGK